MSTKSYTLAFFVSLLGSTLCVIPEGEIQIGPIFGQGSRIFGQNKHFQIGFEKGGDLKHILAKKALLGVGVLGAGAVAAGGAALIAKKFPHLHNGWGWGSAGSSGYGKGQYSNNYNSVPVQASYGGWNNNQQYYGGYNQQAAVADLKFPASSYPASTSSNYGNNNNYYPSTSYGYPEPEQSDWQASSGSYGGSYGWSR